MWIDPNNSNYLINGNDGGVNISYDGGQTWKNLENLPVVQFYNVELDNEKPFNVYGSVQDNFSWVGPSNHNPDRNDSREWKRAPGGEASYHAVDPDDPKTLYSELFYGSLTRTDLSTGDTKRIKPKPAEGEPRLRGQWLAPFMLSPHNSRVVYHGMNHLFRSMNRGDQWERISPDLTDNDPDKQGNISFATITTISESPLKFGLIYVGTDDGRLHVTRNGGGSWTEILNGLPPHKWVSRVLASRFDEGTVYVTHEWKTRQRFPGLCLQVGRLRSDVAGHQRGNSWRAGQCHSRRSLVSGCPVSRLRTWVFTSRRMPAKAGKSLAAGCQSLSSTTSQFTSAIKHW